MHMYHHTQLINYLKSPVRKFQHLCAVLMWFQLLLCLFRLYFLLALSCFVILLLLDLKHVIFGSRNWDMQVFVRMYTNLDKTCSYLLSSIAPGDRIVNYLVQLLCIYIGLQVSLNIPTQKESTSYTHCYPLNVVVWCRGGKDICTLIIKYQVFFFFLLY